MSNSVFLDTSGWLALLNASERLHASALGLWLDLLHASCRIVLTDWIIAETGNGLARLKSKGKFFSIVQEVVDAPLVEVVEIIKC